MFVPFHPANMAALFFLVVVLPFFLIVSNVVVIEARFIVEKNSISVLSPYSMHSKHDASIGNFGVPDYGGSLVGTVVYPKKDSNGCTVFDGDKPFKSQAHRPNFLLLDRGDCYFALKVWNGQQAGAAAVLVADSIDEPLITMDSPEESTDADGYIDKIGIPSALIGKSFGDTLKEALKKGEEVVIKMDWTESMPHPDQRVEYELWTNSNDECGVRCDEQMNFIKSFKGHAQILEKGGYTMFTPHYITWYCPEAFILSSQCKSQCVNHGRYCAPDPEQDFGEGYQGKDIVFENLRQLCVHRVANESNRSWVWWDYVTDFHIRCSMKQKRYSKECAEEVMKSLDLPVEKIKKCMGDPEANVVNEVLKTEQDLQVGRGPRGDVTILPTMVVNDVQYRGKLERAAVLKAICAGFKETTEPSICLSGDLETNECLERNGGCWRDPKSNVTACKDTFRGRVCECPSVIGVQYKGDGYTSCEDHTTEVAFSTLDVQFTGYVARILQRCGCTRVGSSKIYAFFGRSDEGTAASLEDPSNIPDMSVLGLGTVGPGRCTVNNGGCWSETRNGETFSACSEADPSGCKCPFGFQGDGHKCQDVDECKEGLACQCDGCSCKNTWGGYDCKCKGNQLYIMEHDTCIERHSSKVGRVLIFSILAIAVGAGVAGYIFYKYRLRSYMDSEIMAIMSQYMPLDNNHQNQVVVHHETEPLRQSSV